MKVVQVGILIALVAVGALLFMIYTGRNPDGGASAVRTLEPQAETAAPPAAQAPVAAPVPAPPDVPASPVRKASAKPSPAPPARQPDRDPISGTGSGREAGAPRPEPAAETAARAPMHAPEAAAPAHPVSAPDPGPHAAAAPPVSAKPRTVTIAAGTLLPVRLAETLSTEKVKEGDTFTATLDRPLVVDGMVIAERGARAEGQVTEAVQAGRVRGVASLSVRLTRLLTSDGQRVDIQTDAFQQQGETTRREDAIKVGGGAGIGAAIGAIAGGGRGAAIGAAIGGAAGAGTAAATRGKPAVLPVETRIEFRVSQPFTLTEQK